MNDIGKVTNDNNDVRPVSPIQALSNIHSAPSRNKQTKTLKPLTEFNPELNADKNNQPLRDSWWAIIIDIDTKTVVENKTYYEVQLQDGRIVQAYYPEETIEHQWHDNQRVHVVNDGTDFIIMTTPTTKNINLLWKATHTLYPGTTAKGKILTWNDEEAEFKDNKSEIEITDTNKNNFVLRDEKVQVTYNGSGYEIVGSNGLSNRKAKTKVTISPNGSGLVTVYTKGAVAKEPDDHNVDQNVEVTANLNWASGGKSVTSGKEIFIDYFTDEEKWVITGGEC